jgi:hypothetical protein
MNPPKPLTDNLSSQRWWSSYIEARSGLESFSSALDVYSGIVEDTRAGSTTLGGTVHLCLHDTIASDLREIERFMRYALFGPFDMAFRNPRGEPYQEGPEQRYRLFFYKQFFLWTWLDISSFVVSPLVRLFYDTLDDLNLRQLNYGPRDAQLSWTDHPDLIRLDNLYNGNLRTHSDLYDLFVKQVCIGLRGQTGETFKRDSACRILLALRHHRACIRFVRRVLEQAPTVWISRLEFGYDHAMNPKPDEMTAFTHLRRLIETEMAVVHGIDHLGFLWHADYNAARGYAFQVFWFDRTDPRRLKLEDETILHRLSLRWSQEITQGGGYAQDCADSLSPYKCRFESEMSGRLSLTSSSLDWTLSYLFRKPLYYSVKGIDSHGINTLPRPRLRLKADSSVAPTSLSVGH